MVRLFWRASFWHHVMIIRWILVLNCATRIFRERAKLGAVWSLHLYLLLHWQGCWLLMANECYGVIVCHGGRRVFKFYQAAFEFAAKQHGAIS